MLSAGARQIPVLDKAGAGTCPPDNTETIYSRKVNFLVLDNFVGVITIHHYDDVILNSDRFNVLACDVVLINQTSLDIVVRPIATIHVVINERRFSSS